MDRFFILYLYRREVFKTNQQSFVFCIIAAQAAGRSNENIAGGKFFYQSVLDMLDAFFIEAMTDDDSAALKSAKEHLL